MNGIAMLAFSFPILCAIVFGWRLLRRMHDKRPILYFTIRELFLAITVFSLMCALVVTLRGGSQGASVLAIMLGVYLFLGGALGTIYVSVRHNSGSSLRSGSRTRGTLLGLAVMALVFVAVCGVMLRKSIKTPRQTLGAFTAVRTRSLFSIGEVEVLSLNELSVVPTHYRSTPVEQRCGVRRDIRVLGIRIGGNSNQFEIGKPDHDLVAVRKYILQTKLRSDNPEDRLWAIRHLWVEPYEGQIDDVRELINDPDEQVRLAAADWIRAKPVVVPPEKSVRG